MPSKSTAVDAPAPMIDGCQIELFRVTGSVEVVLRDREGHMVGMRNLGQVELYAPHLPPQDDSVFRFEVRAREAQDVHEQQEKQIAERLEALRAKQAGLPVPETT